ASGDLISRLESAINAAAPTRITANVLLTNKGGSPMALRPFALLSLITKKPGTEQPATVFVEMSYGQGEEELVIDAGKAIGVNFISNRPVVELFDNKEFSDLLGGDGWKAGDGVDKSRLKQLYEVEGLTAAISLARAGTQKEKSRLGPSGTC